MLTAEPVTASRYASERRLLVQVSELLYRRRMTELQGGNMSLRVDAVAITTPTRASDFYGWRLPAEDALILDLEGGVIEGDAGRISRETALHARLYRAFPEVGAVFHLHLPEALAAAASGRWKPGVVTDDPRRYGATIVLLEPGLRAQTEPHDRRVVQLLSAVPREAGAISISPGHGIFSIARDWATNVAAADIFRQRLALERLRGLIGRGTDGAAEPGTGPDDRVGAA